MTICVSLCVCIYIYIPVYLLGLGQWQKNTNEGNARKKKMHGNSVYMEFLCCEPHESVRWCCDSIYYSTVYICARWLLFVETCPVLRRKGVQMRVGQDVRTKCPTCSHDIVRLQLYYVLHVYARSFCAQWLLFVTPVFAAWLWTGAMVLRDRVADSTLMPSAYPCITPFICSCPLTSQLRVTLRIIKLKIHSSQRCTHTHLRADTHQFSQWSNTHIPHSR